MTMTCISSTALLFSISKLIFCHIFHLDGCDKLLFAACIAAGILYVLGSESWSVEVESGQSASLLCSNYTSSLSSISWFRAVRRSTLGRILTINSPSEPVSSEDQRFTLTSNLSHIFLTIKPVNTLDTGLYFCGYDSTLGLVIKGSTHLDVKEGILKMDKVAFLVGAPNFTLWMSIALGSLCILLIVVIVGANLVYVFNKIVKYLLKSYSTATDNLNYAAVNFQPKARRTKRSLHTDTNVIYTGTR
uniref:Ig-like domain-containing protein n=1 Tax=Periophthalmus magnuspinnatus TaxID=409849 RepID=A0A3B3ZP90_9GOBI